VHEAPGRARGGRAHRAHEGGPRRAVHAAARAAAGPGGVDRALREVLDRQARRARALPLSRTGAADMEEASLKHKPSLTLTREYAAPPESVWRAWTDAKALKQWWGPTPGEKVSVAEVDVRVGGRYRICFGGADGNEHECAGVYKEVTKPKKLVFTWSS